MMEANNKELSLATILGILIGGGFIGLVDTDTALINQIYKCDSSMEYATCFEIRDSSGDRFDYRCLYDETNKRKYFSCDSGWLWAGDSLQVDVVASDESKGETVIIVEKMPAKEAVIESKKKKLAGGAVVILPGGTRYFPDQDGKWCFREGNLMDKVRCDEIA